MVTYTITKEPHSINKNSYKEYGINKVKDQGEIEILLYQSFLATSTYYLNILLLRSNSSYPIRDSSYYIYYSSYLYMNSNCC